MVNIQLLCVGKLKEKHFAAACAEYVKRLGAFCKLTVTELPEDRLPDNPSQAQIDAALEKEAAAILAKRKSRAEAFLEAMEEAASFQIL